jgi:hypothetical protein
MRLIIITTDGRTRLFGTGNDPWSRENVLKINSIHLSPELATSDPRNVSKTKSFDRPLAQPHNSE